MIGSIVHVYLYVVTNRHAVADLFLFPFTTI